MSVESAVVVLCLLFLLLFKVEDFSSPHLHIFLLSFRLLSLSLSSLLFSIFFVSHLLFTPVKVRSLTITCVSCRCICI